MREILFRAKRQDNDEFVEGYLISENYIRLHIGVYHNEEYICDRTEDYPVKPETVGQFTGLIDKNGKKIFEGDILTYYQQDGAKLKGKPIMCVGKVIYNDKTLSYAVEGKDEIGCKNYDYLPLKKEFEVIGNIYDQDIGEKK